ncbi:AMP-binding protein [Kordia algicida OT-1]|uniref:O-succinylbenzoic acid-CoA ligase n=1 Tax=Kordia algicida OT-1 TaxID=391587 RepID=A9DV58_9FLAO|nr:AMP-binding protein [Kordia algicida]EDP96378.1 O-succinylbenzoic acid-CoA ligase [Kordia algicida OT-1]
MIPNFKNIHRKFKLNGNHFGHEELKEVAYSFIKEGNPHEQTLGDFLLDWLDEKTYVDVFTSGSTGKPKPIRLDKQAMVHSALATGDFFGIKSGDAALQCLPSNFIAGKMMLVRAMILGLSLDVIAPTSNPLKNHDKDYDFCAMVPLQVENSLEQLHQIKTLIIGGAPASSTLIEHLQTVTTNVFATYGMTETITHIAAKPLNHLPKGKKTYYKTLPNIQIQTDNRNCLVIHAPRITEGKIITNDVVHIISKTEFDWLGRFDNVINSGGVKLHPEQIEEKLSPFINTRYFVASIDDERLGKKLILIIEDPQETIDTSSLLETIKTSKNFNKFEIPKNIYTTKNFTETNTGKVQRLQTLISLSI